MSRHRLYVVLATLLIALTPAAAADTPSAAEVRDLLRREPITVESWPVWRGRLRDWIGDRGQHTEPAYQAAYDFLRRQTRLDVELPPALKDDALAWYFLGSAYLEGGNDRNPGVEKAEAATRSLLALGLTDKAHRDNLALALELRNDRQPEAVQAEAATRRSLALEPAFGRAHRNLAWAVALRDGPRPAWYGPRPAVERELEEAHRLEPTLSLPEMRGEIAAQDRHFADAEALFAEARRERPDDLRLARQQATACLLKKTHEGRHAAGVKEVLDRFPDDGLLVTVYGVALAADGDARAGLKELDRSRRLGFDPAQVVPARVLHQIEEQGTPTLRERAARGAAWGTAYFVGLYAAVMLFMTVAGWVLARFTRGTRSLRLLSTDPSELIVAGRVARSRHESWLASLYVLLLLLGLILFYAAIPFLVVGILTVTAGLLYLFLQLPVSRISLYLILIVAVFGLGGAWALFKSLFARPGRGAFGIPKTAANCPRLYEVLGEVARRVDTRPVDAVYLAPGSSISVHQEGRGPFGIFGVKRRVLTLGLSTMNFLTVGELKSILAHEYTHFSHSDTFYSRFIYQVKLSLGEAARGTLSASGILTYVNPLFWFLYLYYKAYNLLSSGFSRSREFLADRMAAGLYGSDVFALALKKVGTEGRLFEQTAFQNIIRLLSENKALTNVYAAFRSYRDAPGSAEQRAKVYQDLLAEKESLFASHPTFGARVEAVAPLPKADKYDDTPAMHLFDSTEALEQELTKYLTGYVHYLRQLRGQ